LDANLLHVLEDQLVNHVHSTNMMHTHDDNLPKASNVPYRKIYIVRAFQVVYFSGPETFDSKRFWVA
jgi:hypothetical protein